MINRSASHLLALIDDILMLPGLRPVTIDLKSRGWTWTSWCGRDGHDADSVPSEGP